MSTGAEHHHGDDTGPPSVTVDALCAWYGEMQVLHHLSFSIVAGRTLSIIGANGAGKSTLLKALVGQMSRGRAAHVGGQVRYGRARLDELPTEAIVDLGITLVPEGRRLFKPLSVEDNLLAGAFLPRCRKDAAATLASVYELFPKLGQRRRQVVARMSGGEQQMVAIGRALMSRPKVILFDEISLGLSPAVVDDIYGNMAAIRAQGITCVIVEQNTRRALSVADDILVMLEGRIVLAGKPLDFSLDQVTAAYFGAVAA